MDNDDGVKLGGGSLSQRVQHVVPRGVWHRLVMRRPGRLLFINSRSGMQSRTA